MPSGRSFDKQELALIERLYELNDEIHMLTESCSINEQQRRQLIVAAETKITITKASILIFEQSTDEILENINDDWKRIVFSS